MTDDKSLLDLSSDEFLRRKIKYLKNRVRELHAEIKRNEELLRLYEAGPVKTSEDPKQLVIGVSMDKESLDFSLTFWRQQVYNFLFDQTAQYTTDQILVGVDFNKMYQRDKTTRARAVKAISTSLFHLHKEGKVAKKENDGRRGFKWSYKDFAQSVLDEKTKP